MIDLLLIGDRQSSKRELLTIFERKPDMKVIGIASSGQEAIRQVEALQPKIVLMDNRIPIANGIEAISIISQQFYYIRIVEIDRFNKVRHIANWLQLGEQVHMFRTQINASIDDLPRTFRTVDSEDRLMDAEPENSQQLSYDELQAKLIASLARGAIIALFR